MTEQEEREVRAYLRSQTAEKDNDVELVLRVGRRRVAGYTHDLYDVWMSKGDRWWVITGMTNLYSQEAFPDLDQVFTFHLGAARLRCPRGSSRAWPMGAPLCIAPQEDQGGNAERRHGITEQDDEPRRRGQQVGEADDG
jgi:hypothetical protein